MKPGPLVVRRQPALASLLLPRTAIGYDLLVFVGQARFVQFRQREEIQVALREQYGITLSTGEISNVAHHFLDYLEALHQARAPELRRALEADGGWPLHIDATGEGGRGTLLVAYTSWRGWVLGAWKIPTERADAVLPKLNALKELFGAPCSVMRDLGRAVIEAARDFVAGLTTPIPVLGCHMHFLKDVGKDLLNADHEALRGLFRQFDVVSDLRAFVRGLGRRLGTAVRDARRDARLWFSQTEEHPPLPTGEAGLDVVRTLGQWALDYPADGLDEGFPFDRPMLDLYTRCFHLARALKALLRRTSDAGVTAALERLLKIIAPVLTETVFARTALKLDRRASLFDDLRDALRLHPKWEPLPAPSVEARLKHLRDVQQAVEKLQRSLRDQRPSRGQSLREAFDLVLDHLDRHGSSLWGHAIPVASAPGGLRIVERTNVVLESFFHRMKHGERRRSGRKILSQDFENLPAAAALAHNLACPDYVKLLCGSLEALPRAFASLDAASRTRSLPARRRAESALAPPDIASPSLSKADRNTVRTGSVRRLILAEPRQAPPPRAQIHQPATVD
jgi:hypothetical protein